MRNATRIPRGFRGFHEVSELRNPEESPLESPPPAAVAVAESSGIHRNPQESSGTGAILDAPVLKYTLQKGNKGESITTKLKAKHYGTSGKWYLAEKK